MTGSEVELGSGKGFEAEKYGTGLRNEQANTAAENR